MVDALHPDTINAITHGDHGAPRDVLGAHQVSPKKVVVRAFRPTAKTLTLIDERKKSSKKVEMEMLDKNGLFEVSLTGTVEKLDYSFEEVPYEGETFTFKDPYAYPMLLGEMDIYLHGEGRNWRIYDKLGAQLREIDGVKGINFAVWAPNARRLSVIGDFNNWDGRVHPMHQNGESGVWEIFIPGLDAGMKYKYEMKSHHMGYMEEKIDPYGFYAERRPKKASIVANLDTYEWGDDEWMSARAEKNMLEEPMSTYEVHLGSWKRNDGNEWMSYRELADDLVNYVVDMGYTHIELMPVAEHPFDGSWGYQVTGYYAPTSRYGTPDDFMYFVDKCHQAGIGVIVDWVPAHFPKDGHALSFFDGTHLYSHEDSRKGEHPDWGTYIFNYGRNEVRNFLIANALFWLEKYHIDGLRVDAVSSMVYLDFSREDGQWIANEYGGNENLDAVSFIQEANAVIHEKFPGAVTIAEESTAWPMVSRPTYLGGLGFTFKWNMGWMHDTLWYFSKNPVYRKWEHNKLTFSMVYAYNENFVLSLSHDEVVHGKGSLMGKLPGDWWQKFAQMRMLFAYMYTHPGKKLTFMGSEIGQWSEWSEARSLDWHLMDMGTHQKLNQFVKDVNHLYKNEPALWEIDFAPEGFRWIEANDSENSVFSYVRYSKEEQEAIVVVLNFTPVPRLGYRIGVPKAGHYDELLNSDADIYGGSNVGNMGGVDSQSHPAHGFDQSISLALPPLGALVFKYKG
ncbi:MAG: 1,4-alpha-glucan branching protein GlgB [Chloroflexota bacterium]